MAIFNYKTAFKRTIGWITEDEQEILRNATVAIAGLGGVGGSHLLTLVRLGVGRFSIADYDLFELHNMNRQAGASMSQLGRPKVDVLQEMALDINPELQIQTYPEGISAGNVAQFLDGADVYVDGLDFFVYDARQLVFREAAASGIPAFTAAPLGMSTAFLAFHPDGLSFDQYFQIHPDLSEEEKALRFMLGLAPSGLHGPSLVDPSTINLKEQSGPSTPMGCELCAGVIGTQVLKWLLQRGKTDWAPWAVQFDAYRMKLRRTWRPGGNSHPVQRLALWLARRRMLSG